MRLPALHRLGRALVIVALILSLGAHWALLQSIAWAGMLYTYSQQTSFTQAVVMTFDGDHPCSLCKRIQKGRSQERQEDRETVRLSHELKLDLPPLAFIFVHPPQPRIDGLALTEPSFLSHTPEVPPPRIG